MKKIRYSLLLMVLTIFAFATKQTMGMLPGDIVYFDGSYSGELIREIDNQLNLYEDLCRERKQYENKSNNIVHKWLSGATVLCGAIGSAIGAKKIVNTIEKHGYLDDVLEAEKSYIKGWSGTVVGLSLFAATYFVGSRLFNGFVARAISKGTCVGKLLALNPYFATQYLKKRLEQTKNFITQLCSQLSFEDLDRLRHSIYSPLKKELLMNVAQELCC